MPVDIRSLILSILEEKKVMMSDVHQIESIQIDGNLDEIPTDILLTFTCPYIRGVIFDKCGEKEKAFECFKEYHDDCVYFKVVKKDTIDLCKEDRKYGNRENKIKMIRKMKMFRFDYIDWNDREWVMDLLEYFYMKSIQESGYLKMEMELARGRSGSEYDMNKEIECIKVDERGNRENIFVSRNEPTISLEEFADQLISSLPEAKTTEAKDESSSEQYSRLELIERDEENDDRNIRRGNTLGMG